MSEDQCNYLPVNWMDGMKINKSHFLSQNNAIMHDITKSVSSLLNKHNYGLIPTDSGKNAMKIFISSDNEQQVKVRLQTCIAVTLGGHLIQIDENDFLYSNLNVRLQTLSIPFTEIQEKSSEYFVVLIANPYKRVPCGDADPDEMPPRLPYTSTFYELQLMPVSEVKEDAIGNFHLPLARIKIEGHNVVLDENFIPPCCGISSHNNLLQMHAGIENFLGKMELFAIQIIQKIFQKKQQNEMVFVLQKLCEQISFFTATHLNEFKQLNLYQPPIFLINTVSSFARLIKNTLDFYIGAGKEELINYCVEWCEVSQGELEGKGMALSNHHYNHLDINNSVKKVSDFIKIINDLFSKLARLEYIGKRKDMGIFVNEQRISSGSEPQSIKRRSFLDD